MRYLTFWGKIFFIIRASKLHDNKFWLMLSSNYGCQLWVITCAFRKHWLCLCTWRVVSGTCSSTAALLPCHLLSPQLSQAAHEEPGPMDLWEWSCSALWSRGCIFTHIQDSDIQNITVLDLLKTGLQGSHQENLRCTDWFRQFSRWALSGCIFVMNVLQSDVLLHCTAPSD